MDTNKKIKEILSSEPKMGVQHEPFAVSDSATVMFRIVHFAGMVGEACERISCYLIDHSKPEIAEINYEQVKELYKKIDGRSLRIEYFYLMKCMSPEGLESQLEREQQQAMSIVR